jgi:hypothetical protein
MNRSDAQLAIPPAALNDDKAFEILRVWVADGAQLVCLRSAVWSDPAAWGIMLADITRHIANSYVQGGSPTDMADILTRIRAGFAAEMDSSTDAPVGQFHTH